MCGKMSKLCSLYYFSFIIINGQSLGREQLCGPAEVTSEPLHTFWN